MYQELSAGTPFTLGYSYPLQMKTGLPTAKRWIYIMSVIGYGLMVRYIAQYTTQLWSEKLV